MDRHEDPFDDVSSAWIDDSQDAISKGFIEFFKIIKDPRMANKTGHLLLDVIFIAVCAYISGANSWDGVYEFSKVRESWLRKYIKLQRGLPSRVTYWRVFSHLNPIAFEECFQSWAESLLSSTRHIAIDGKALRGVYDAKDPNASLILVSAWATDCSLLLGQIKTDVKSNEITAIPKLLDMIHIKNCLVSIDAIGCQVEIAKKITDLGGDYLFSLKGNQGNLIKDVELFFSDMISMDWKGFDYEYTESLEKGHGRIESRKVYLVQANESLRERWSKIQSLIMVISSRTIKGRETIETRYYISSSHMHVNEMALSIRRHWGIENGLHWSLDVGFREDRQVAQRTNLAENLAIIRRISFNHLKQEKSLLSIENKRLKAAMSTEFLENILKITEIDS